MNKINDIILGTAQFGSNYGVGTLKGNLYNSNKSLNLLKKAYSMGIRNLDTASTLHSIALSTKVNAVSKLPLWFIPISAII